MYVLSYFVPSFITKSFYTYVIKDSKNDRFTHI